MRSDMIPYMQGGTCNCSNCTLHIYTLLKCNKCNILKPLHCFDSAYILKWEKIIVLKNYECNKLRVDEYFIRMNILKLIVVLKLILIILYVLNEVVQKNSIKCSTIQNVKYIKKRVVVIIVIDSVF
jgi:hypothetical protein